MKKTIQFLMLGSALTMGSIGVASAGDQQVITKLQSQIQAMNASTNQKLATQQKQTQQAIAQLQTQTQKQLTQLRQMIQQVENSSVAKMKALQASLHAK